MIEKKLSGLSPVRLRMILILSMFAIIIISSVSFWFFRGWLEQYALSVSTEAQKAEISNNDVANLQNVKKMLEENKVAVNRTKNIVADSQSYAYQNQIIRDIDAYAKAAGISIAGYVFNSDAAAGSAAPGSTAPAPAPTGLKTVSVTVTVNTPVNYRSVMNFIHSIESNLTKMQLTGVTLRQDTEGANAVSIEPLTIEVYVK